MSGFLFHQQNKVFYIWGGGGGGGGGGLNSIYTGSICTRSTLLKDQKFR